MPYYTLLWSIQSVARAQEYICIAMCEMPSYNHHRLVISLDHLILFDQSEKLEEVFIPENAVSHLRRQHF